MVNQNINPILDIEGLGSNPYNFNPDIKELKSGIQGLKEETTQIAERVYVKEFYQNGLSGYRIWSNNLCEQWGQRGSGANDKVQLINAYKDKDSYIILTGCNSNNVNQGTPTLLWYEKEASYFRLQGRWNGAANSGVYGYWYTIGYIN